MEFGEQLTLSLTTEPNRSQPEPQVSLRTVRGTKISRAELLRSDGMGTSNSAMAVQSPACATHRVGLPARIAKSPAPGCPRLCRAPPPPPLARRLNWVFTLLKGDCACAGA